MSHSRRKRTPLSPARKNIGELMRLSRNIPLVTAERRMELAAVLDARQEHAVKLSWTTIFIKAFATVAAQHPTLRTAYCSFPYAHLYEHDANVAMVVVEREFEGERFPMYCQLRSPDRLTLLELHESLEKCRMIPLQEDPRFRRMQWIGRLPGLLRRLAWNLGYHWSGRKRAHYFGTFGLSSPAASGAGLTALVSPLTCTLHYGLFDEAGRLDMRITFDHRVIDGAPVARALAEMEQVLVTEILAEIKNLPRFAKPARSSSQWGTRILEAIKK